MFQTYTLRLLDKDGNIIKRVNFSNPIFMDSFVNTYSSSIDGVKRSEISTYDYSEENNITFYLLNAFLITGILFLITGTFYFTTNIKR